MRHSIRRWCAVIRATALEMTSEPLALMLTLSAIATVVICSSLHFHQFGEPSRMARDAGLSAILVFGILQSVFCTIKVFRREIESGTLQMALSHPISRTGFFLSKAFGAMIAYGLFALTVFAVTRAIVIGAELGFWISRTKGDIPLVWPPAIWACVAVVVLPLLIGAAMDRFAHWRFTTTASWMALLSAWASSWILSFLAKARFAELVEKNAGLASVDLFSSCGRLLPAAVAVTLTAPVFIFAAASFAVRFRDNAAASLAGLVFLAAVPALGNYYLSDALAKGGAIAWSYVGLAGVATIPFVVAFTVLGLMFFKARDVG